MTNDGPAFRLVIGNRKYSSWSLRGWLAMKLSGVAFGETVVPLDLPETPGLLAQHSPSGRVPCLVHGDRVIWDSLAITEFMAEQFPDAGIWPADPALRATARSVVAEMHSGFLALRSEFPMDMLSRHAGVMPSLAAEADISRIDALWRDCLAVSGGPFLFGEWSAADCFYAPVVSRFETFGLAASAGSSAYADRVRAHPDYREWLGAARQESWETPLSVLMGP